MADLEEDANIPYSQSKTDVKQDPKPAIEAKESPSRPPAPPAARSPTVAASRRRLDAIASGARESSPVASPQAAILRRKARDRAAREALGVTSSSGGDGVGLSGSAGRLALLSPADLAASDRGGFGSRDLDARLPRNVPAGNWMADEGSWDPSVGTRSKEGFAVRRDKSRHELLRASADGAKRQRSASEDHEEKEGLEDVYFEGGGGYDHDHGRDYDYEYDHSKEYGFGRTVEGIVDPELLASMASPHGSPAAPIRSEALEELERNREALSRDIDELGLTSENTARLQALQIELRQLDSQVEQERNLVAHELDDFDAIASHLHRQLSLLASLRNDADVLRRVPPATLERITHAAEAAVEAVSKAAQVFDAPPSLPTSPPQQKSQKAPPSPTSSSTHSSSNPHIMSLRSLATKPMIETVHPKPATDSNQNNDEDEVWIVRH